MERIYYREHIEENEKKVLRPYACLSMNTEGRKFKEEEHVFRTCFQRDRDRIIHCKAFRRLKGKTQVFLGNHGDHYRTRLTHTLEVAQISRGIARTLGLNEDLAEAIALAHDLGHTPYGHAGEAALNKIMEEFNMEFEHNIQSQRIVENLEISYPNFVGLNLSREVLEGLMKHVTPWDNHNNHSFDIIRPPLEAEIVNIADEIAYQNHDVDDGLRSMFISDESLQNLDIWKESDLLFNKRYKFNPATKDIKINRKISIMISLMIDDVIKETEKRLEKNNINNFSDLKNYDKRLVSFSRDYSEKNKSLREFLFKEIYSNSKIIEEMDKGKKIIDNLFRYFYKNWEEFNKKNEFIVSNNEEKVIYIKDFIAGMSDDFAFHTAKKLELI
ncbi:MAG: Deoxyguanosinetriphosphate triphosphohydrolase-like protein [Candidatus Peregrinibacteria bacterium GW2011_GWA2_33_10]|nr:MAG: Deoxyguanosinetriphosphate triphosphohydrolase-like protein [Candidatus Peregrinibacteria bacterium GW2011_GWA2_33_10]KKP41040.1 MAG: deoxyguanosinetriphosphate triphosphohydrolase-like protein, dGTPase [Candidatus Peregrinibacteria bacterium GW2011_GWC2_33_13]OGJ49853.1 MAG: hypothetical protein A2229_00010 [Candidatus Peregrinibacteria bacterium RIFOXYA2_FULL_33_7]